MAKDNGYWQAIDNLAYYVRQLADESQGPLLDSEPSLMDDFDAALEACAANMTPEQRARWDTLETAVETIVRTYEVHPEEVWKETFARMMKYDLEAGMLDEFLV